MGSLESDTTERLHFHFSLSCFGEGNGNPLQCSCLENPRDGEAWWAAVYGIAQSQTRLNRHSSSRGTKISQPMQHSQKKNKTNQKPYMVCKTYNILLSGNTYKVSQPLQETLNTLKAGSSCISYHLSRTQHTACHGCPEHTCGRTKWGCHQRCKRRNKFKC